jgi:hypothetical protein
MHQMRRFFALLTLTLICGSVFGQPVAPSSERARFQDRRKSILDANNVRATYHNFGHQGVSNGANRDELYYEFPKNTNRQYIYFVAAFIGAEVNNQAGGNVTPRFPIVVAPNFRTNPQTGSSWALNPIPGYFNSNSSEIARSDQGPRGPLQNTWPSFWPDKMADTNDPGWGDSWNGFFGKNIFNADQEFYYRAGDDLYTRYLSSATTQYRPDQTDATRGGLGLIVDSRVLAWTQRLISNVHFAIYEVRNDASFDYDKVSFMLWIADWVGTPQDDRPFFDQQRATAFFTDTRPSSSPPEFSGTQIGVAGVRFLETPGNAVDGIDNDGDADFYISESNLYDPRNKDLITALISVNGGFFDNRSEVLTQVMPLFTASDFNERTINPGDRIVLIDDNGNRILTTYPTGLTADLVVRSQGRDLVLPRNGMTVREDTLLGRHLNLFDDDLDGLIDENQPNHLTLSRFINGVEVTRPVRFVNYRWSGFYTGLATNTTAITHADTIQPGLMVPNSWIRARMASDATFREQIVDYQNMLKTLYAGTLPAAQFDSYFMHPATHSPMIDESRDDFFDNNQDWRSGSDDVGLDGVELSGDRGEMDGFPTSGAFSPFPGETAIDKTDVRETDAIGITAATFRPAGGLNLSGPDLDIWNRHMVPGLFSPAPDASQDTDQFVTAGFFPLRRGAIERFALAVSISASNSSNNASVALVEAQLAQAFNAYDANYQFAIAPPPPPTKAVPGNGYVTLYWEDNAESVFDRYLARLGANPFNFEGYKIFRATDPALLDAKVITDGRGTPEQFLTPIAQFDKKNGIMGNHPIDIFGIEFNLGNDTGLQRYYVDTDVINGRTYYYAVVAYNNGAAVAGISPAESPINLSVNPDGSVTAGVNVIRVTPTKPSAGYVGPQDPTVTRVSGTTSGTVVASVVDPQALKSNNRYRITFRDTTLTENGAPITIAGYFSLTNLTTGKVLLENRTSLYANDNDNPVVEGLRVVLTNPVGGNARLVATGPEDVSIQSVTHHPNTREYAIVAGTHSGFGQSRSADIRRGSLRQRLDALATSFRVIDRATGADVPFAYLPHPVLKEMSTSAATRPGALFEAKTQTTLSDQIYLLDGPDGRVSWQIGLEPHQAGILYRLQPGDTLQLSQSTRFSNVDVFEFVIDPTRNMPREDLAQATSALDNIRVVPNPYIVTHIAEKRPTRIRPQQERELHFINLPARCTIRIFNVAGHLVQTLNVNNPIESDRYVWNMLTKDNLELAYGVYIYHVESPGVGEKVGKFAVIK